ncbi:MAG: hypothetical protein U0263_05520 [Polyangiaceae bacterium]
MKEPPPAPTSEDTIHVGPLSGKIDGKPFSAQTARYYIDSRPGFEKIDIKIYASAAKTPCGPLDDPKPPSVWIRRWGPGKPSAEKVTTSVGGTDKWEVHYQIQDEGHWIGNGDANALVVLEDVRPDLVLPGVISACFRDTTGSCVAGEFSASYCRLSIDEPVRGTEAMERPKQALLAPPSAAPPPSATPAPSGAPAPSGSPAPPRGQKP